MKENMTLDDVVHVLENGYETTKRGNNVIERCIDKGGKTVKAVVVKDLDYDGEEYWKLIHVGSFTRW